MNVKVRREDLIKVLETNKTSHLENYKIAYEGYRKECIEVTEKALEQVKNLNKEPPAHFYLPTKPENHASSYDSMITKSKMSVEQEITLSDVEFEKYVMDNWEWKREFDAISSKYNNGLK
jgi:hypothetical protein